MLPVEETMFAVTGGVGDRAGLCAFFFFFWVGASYSTWSYRQGYKRKPPDKEQRTEYKTKARGGHIQAKFCVRHSFVWTSGFVAVLIVAVLMVLVFNVLPCGCTPETMHTCTFETLHSCTHAPLHPCSSV